MTNLTRADSLNDSRENQYSWMVPVQALLIQGQKQGAFIVVMPEYRPDLLRNMAWHMEMTFFDFRDEVMREHGWDAGALGLAELEKALLSRTTDGAVVAHNIEALLATRDENERRRWLTHLLSRDWPNTLLIPLVLYGAEVDAGKYPVAKIVAEDLPADSLISFIANQ